MSFGFSLGDIIAVTELAYRVSRGLRKTRGTDPKFNELCLQVDTLSDSLRAIENIGLDNLKEEEVTEVLIRSAEEIQPSLKHILDILRTPSQPVTEDEHSWTLQLLSVWKRRRRREFPQSDRLGTLVSELAGPVVQLEGLLAQVQRRRAPIPDPRTHFDGGIRHHASWSVQPRTCVLIMLMFAFFVGQSTFLGVFYTVEKQYGYSMGDAFTLAGWVISVGTLISGAVLAHHYPRCKCWGDGDKVKKNDQELQSLVQEHG